MSDKDINKIKKLLNLPQVIEIRLKGGYVLKYKEESHGLFSLTEENLTDETNSELGFNSWDKQKVKNLDLDSDGFSCFGISSLVESNGVKLSFNKIKVRYPEDIIEAFKYVKVVSWNPEDI